MYMTSVMNELYIFSFYFISIYLVIIYIIIYIFSFGDQKMIKL